MSITLPLMVLLLLPLHTARPRLRSHLLLRRLTAATPNRFMKLIRMCLMLSRNSEKHRLNRIVKKHERNSRKLGSEFDMLIFRSRVMLI